MVADADVHGHRHPHLPGLAQTVGYRGHELCRPGKSLISDISQLYHQKPAAIGDAPVSPFRRPAVSGGDSRHMGAVAGCVPAGTNGISFLQSGRCQGTIDGLPVKLHAVDKSLRRPLPLLPAGSERLVPEPGNPRIALLIPKIRMAVIDTGIQYRHQHPLSGQIFPGSIRPRSFPAGHGIVRPERIPGARRRLPLPLQRRDTGNPPAVVQLIVHGFWHLHIDNLRHGSQPFQLLPGHFHNQIPRLEKDNGAVGESLPQPLPLPEIAHNNLPGLVFPVKSRIQRQRPLPGFPGNLQGQIQHIFHLFTHGSILCRKTLHMPFPVIFSL